MGTDNRNEADALFATKRRKQQEEQAEREHKEEMARQKAEMEAEVKRLEEEMARRKAEQEEQYRLASERKEQAEKAEAEAQARAQRANELVARVEEEVKRSKKPFPAKRIVLALGGVILLGVTIVVICMLVGRKTIFNKEFDAYVEDEITGLTVDIPLELELVNQLYDEGVESALQFAYTGEDSEPFEIYMFFISTALMEEAELYTCEDMVLLEYEEFDINDGYTSFSTIRTDNGADVVCGDTGVSEGEYRCFMSAICEDDEDYCIIAECKMKDTGDNAEEEFDKVKEFTAKIIGHTVRKG